MDNDKMDLRAMGAIPGRARQTVRLLSGAFLWDASPQGFDYWRKVHQNLREIADAEEAAIERAERETI